MKQEIRAASCSILQAPDHLIALEIFAEIVFTGRNSYQGCRNIFYDMISMKSGGFRWE
jgi:hypothetical protein